MRALLLCRSLGLALLQLLREQLLLLAIPVLLRGGVMPRSTQGRTSMGSLLRGVVGIWAPASARSTQVGDLAPWNPCKRGWLLLLWL